MHAPRPHDYMLVVSLGLHFRSSLVCWSGGCLHRPLATSLTSGLISTPLGAAAVPGAVGRVSHCFHKHSFGCRIKINQQIPRHGPGMPELRLETGGNEQNPRVRSDKPKQVQQAWGSGRFRGPLAIEPGGGGVCTTHPSGNGGDGSEPLGGGHLGN